LYAQRQVVCARLALRRNAECLLWEGTAHFGRDRHGQTQKSSNIIKNHQTTSKIINNHQTSSTTFHNLDEFDDDFLHSPFDLTFLVKYHEISMTGEPQPADIKQPAA
jgi:hypothetical protein